MEYIQENELVSVESGQRSTLKACLGLVPVPVPALASSVAPASVPTPTPTPTPVTTAPSDDTTTTTDADSTTTADPDSTTTADPDNTTTVDPDSTTTADPDSTTTTVSGTVDPNGGLLGDVNLDGNVNMSDSVLLNKYTVNAVDFVAQQEANANCFDDGTNNIDGNDAMSLLKFQVQILSALPETP